MLHSCHATSTHTEPLNIEIRGSYVPRRRADRRLPLHTDEYMTTCSLRNL